MLSQFDLCAVLGAIAALSCAGCLSSQEKTLASYKTPVVVTEALDEPPQLLGGAADAVREPLDGEPLFVDGVGGETQRVDSSGEYGGSSEPVVVVAGASLADDTGRIRTAVSRDGSSRDARAPASPIIQARRLEAIEVDVAESPTDPGYATEPTEIGEATEPAQAVADVAGSLRHLAVNHGSAAEQQANEGLQVNLPTVLAMVDAQHPAVGIAQWRVQEAYARLATARSLWLPSIRGAMSLHRHDGNYQASSGEIVDVNRSSFQYGLGAGATGAGTTAALPGVVAQFHFADALFQPAIAQSRARAQGHAAQAVTNRQMLQAALAYLELVSAYQDKEILNASVERIEHLAELTKSFAEAGEGLRADADRLQTEWLMIQGRRVAASERIAVAESRLALSVSGSRDMRWVPMDLTVVPWEMIEPQADAAALIATGLRVRPELRESQALVAAACEAFDREKYAPFVPSILLGFSAGGFGGGLGGRLDHIESRYDFDAMLGWEIRNLGFGERTARREASARIQQAKFEKLSVLDTIANEITEGLAQVTSRHEQIRIAQQAIEAAESSVRRNLERIRAGEGLPIEALQAVQASELTSQTYLRAITRYNEAQLRLQFALGWPEIPSETPVMEID